MLSEFNMRMFEAHRRLNKFRFCFSEAGAQMHGPLFCAADQRVEVATLNTLRLYSAVLSLHPALYRSSERCFSACSLQTDVNLEGL